MRIKKIVTKELLGSVVAEMRINALVLFLSGVALFTIGAVRDLPTTLISALAGALICCAPWWWIKWQPMLSNSISAVQVVADGTEVEALKRTVLRGLIRISVSSVPVSVAIIAITLTVDDPHNVWLIADGFLAGIWFAVSLLYLAGARRLRRWELKHSQVIAREVYHWTWSVAAAPAGCSGGTSFNRRRWCFFATRGHEAEGSDLC